MITVTTHTLREIVYKQDEHNTVADFLSHNNIMLHPGNPKGYMLKFRSDKEETLFKLKYGEYL